MEEIRTILCRRLLFLCSIQEAVIGCKLRTAFSSQITWAVCRLPLCFPASSSPPLAWLNREPCAALLNRAEKKEKEMGLAKSYCTGRYRARAGSVCLAGRPGTQRKRTTAREPRVVVGCAHVTTRLFTRPSGLSKCQPSSGSGSGVPCLLVRNHAPRIPSASTRRKPSVCRVLKIVAVALAARSQSCFTNSLAAVVWFRFFGLAICSSTAGAILHAWCQEYDQDAACCLCLSLSHTQLLVAS